MVRQYPVKTMAVAIPEAPPAEPQIEPETLPDDEPTRRDEPSPFDPIWPDDLPVPPPKAWITGNMAPHTSARVGRSTT